MVHVAVNKYDFEKKINILEYAFGEEGGRHQKAYAVYAFINVDKCERPLNGAHPRYFSIACIRALNIVLERHPVITSQILQQQSQRGLHLPVPCCA